ncbi:hypothetical protein KY359_05040 [Candidatus Woesearchaeota archaeon]|nr:hypothetical protein [Candidatus Woesearchaeota archaeon]
MDGIPEISDERLEELASRIKPVVRFVRLAATDIDAMVPDYRGELYFIEDVRLRGRSFLWDPVPVRPADEIELHPYKEIMTLHSRESTVFGPSIAEVLAQIPDDDVNKAVAFETRHLGFVGDFYSAVTRLYVLR